MTSNPLKLKSSKLVTRAEGVNSWQRQMQLYWGVKPFHAKRADSTDVLVYSSIELLKEKGIVKTGDVVVATAGVVTYANRHSPAANTNIMRVAEVD